MSTTVETIASRVQDANDRKSDGNDHFRQSRWTEALVAYQAGLNVLPKRPKKKVVKEDDHLSNDQEDVDAFVRDTPLASSSRQVDRVDDTPKEQVSESESLTEEQQQEVAKLRSILHSNIGACHVKLGEYKEAVEACTEALKDNPIYEKALQRRATANETIDSWSSLTAAQEDYKTLQELTEIASEKAKIEVKLRNLQPKIEVAQKKETTEMMDKLKGLGNNLLGRFGLSTNNFQLQPNGQGGYSMNFVQ